MPDPPRHDNSNNPMMWATVAAVIISIAGAFWTVANPRDDIKQVEARLQSQINERETTETHREFASRIENQISMIVPRNENVVHWDSINFQLSHLLTDVKELQASRVIRPEYIKDLETLRERVALQASIVQKIQDQIGGGGVGKQIDNLQMQIQQLRQSFDGNHQMSSPVQVVPPITP